jgi:hypothetical protein
VTKQSEQMRALGYTGWQLDNSVGVRGGASIHRTWRPVVEGRPLYASYVFDGSGEPRREGPLLYTACGREVYLNAPYPAKRCGVCFRGTT